MKTFISVIQPIIKLSKGLLALISINILIVVGVLIFNSCKETEFKNSDNGKANLRFNKSLVFNKESIAAVSLKKDKSISSKQLRISCPYGESSTIYLSFPYNVTSEIQTSFNNTQTIQDLSNLVDKTDAIIQYEPNANNINYSLEIPITNVVESLNPLVSESKSYLYSKGFTEANIQQMISENGGTELDLIPFVMALTEIEKSQLTLATNNLNLFANPTFAMNEYVRCAMVAIGADVLWALGGSSASTWTVAMMTRAFSVVAKRFLGPIGVAIAVVSFGLCLGS